MHRSAGAWESFVWGVWVSVSEKSFHLILDKWDAEIADDEPARFGWLCNQIGGYPEREEMRCNLYLRSGNLRPLIVLEPTGHPLAVEQRDGISLERIKEIAASAGH